LDKSEIIAILNDWNYWNFPLPETKERASYDSKISSYLEYDEVVVIKGIRRSGKSTLMINQIKRLLQDDIAIKNILFVNLEDPRFINHLHVDLLEQIKEVYLEYLDPENKPYIFLDEIQNIPNWEKWVNKEYELKLSKLIISGSNSSMFSSEIASTLSGRYLAVDVYPLSFREYIDFKDININTPLDIISKKIALNREFENYLKFGAFPKVLEYQEADRRELLTTYKNTILLKDIVARYKLKEFGILEEIAAFLLSNSGISISINKLKNNFKVSYDMANAYVEYLTKAYMIFEINKFDYSLKKQNANDKKYYSVDLGLSNIMRVPNLQTRGNDLETIVFLELLRRGYKVYYYKTSNDLECDFIVQKEQEIKKLIQVTSSLKDEKTRKRELQSFSKTKKELKLEEVDSIVITEDNCSEAVYDDTEIKIINLKEWLLVPSTIL
jgi:predicted AAA+ superfamily ATPase